MAERLKGFFRRAPVLGPVYRFVSRRWRVQTFAGSTSYWEARYQAGGNSGPGSFHRLATFKAEVINAFIHEHGIQSVIEFGCGDGNQISLMDYPTYAGLDVSVSALKHCQARFAEDTTKGFYLYHSEAFADHLGCFQMELALSLDVIYHLIEDRIYEAYLHHLFGSATRFVMIYASNFDQRSGSIVRHRHFTPWVERHCPQWRLKEHRPNPYPHDPADPQNTSHADFYIYERQA